MDDPAPRGRQARPGLRLHKLEVCNWGTFDSTGGQVHSARPAGQTTLLIGQNGSGKSTLVDALLTLLVRPVVRNYNVAAGAHKQERDERTYIKGACGHTGRDDDNRAEMQFLRPGGASCSVLLACFRNESTDAAFTLALVLYLNSEGRSEKLYCLAPGEHSIAEHFSGLTETDKIRQQVQKRGFRCTPHYKEYHSWFAKLTGVRPKAMDMFNQTVAVKDIQSLNRFIRDHMLEAAAWGEKVDSLLNHFTQLSEAHQSLVRVRRQFELLEPIAKVGAEFREAAERLRQTQRLLDAAGSFFSHKTIELLTAECAAWEQTLAQTRHRKEQLGQEMALADEEKRRLMNEIEQAGGERLRQIPLLIENHEGKAAAKRDANHRYHDALRAAGIAAQAADAAGFAALAARLPSLARQIKQELAAAAGRRDELVIERGEAQHALAADERELEALAGRQGNLPEAFAEVRRRLCEELRLPEKELPFAAELLAVKPGERAWEASLEMVLRSFALSLLVPQRHYSLVSRYVDRTRLADARGHGQRLVYLRVGERSAAAEGPVPGGQSLLRKLDFRDGHPLLPWVQGELAERFDYRCCDAIEEFQEACGLALTRQRHVKIRGTRHEKDDREKTADPRHFVLGWDNREKCRRLAEAIAAARQRQERLSGQIERLDAGQERHRQRGEAVRRASEPADFSAIDFAAHEREIAALRQEKRTIEERSDVIQHLKQRLAEAESRREGLRCSRDETVAAESDLARQVRDAAGLIENARRQISARQAAGGFERDAESFAELEACFAQSPLTAGNLFDQSRAFLDERRAVEKRIQRELDPLRDEMTKAMLRYLRELPDESADLGANADYLDSFLVARERIRRDDLPRHERRFKDRLNEKVTHEIGLLNGALHSESGEIKAKIEQLNQSLRQLEYRPGTFMRLEPRPVRDREIAEFQHSLRECLAGTFEGSLEADEARYLRIEKLIARLRDEERWREKVTDVRRWFDFVAREIDQHSGAERGYYEDSSGQSGGEKAKLAFTILVAAIAYQYDLAPERAASERFHFVVVDEMFSKVDDQYAEFALELFAKFGLQLLIVAPLDAKARVTEPYVGCYLHVVKDVQTNHSEIFSMTAREFEEAVAEGGNHRYRPSSELARQHPR